MSKALAVVLVVLFICNGRMVGKRASRKDYKALGEGRGSIDLSEEETIMSEEESAAMSENDKVMPEIADIY